MAENKKLEKKDQLQKEDEIEELKSFINKKKIQNDALKKIMDKLNATQKHKNENI